MEQVFAQNDSKAKSVVLETRTHHESIKTKEVNPMYAELISPEGIWDPGIPCVSWGGVPIDASCTNGNIPRQGDCALTGSTPT